jgi:hypothetical protein
MSGELDLNDLNDLPVGGGGGGGAAVASEDDENDASTASTSAAPAPMQKKASALMTIKNKLVGSKSNALAISRCRRTRRSSWFYSQRTSRCSVLPRRFVAASRSCCLL